MTWRKAHGKAKKHGALVVVETAPADELPAGVQAEPQAEGTAERDAKGRWRKGTRTAQSKGGKARNGKTRLADKLKLAPVTADPAFAPYLKDAEAFKRRHVTDLAQQVGGGYCGPGPSGIIASAALQLAASRYFFDQVAVCPDPDLALKASRLADSAKQALLTAHELCAREAKARPKPSNQERLLADLKRLRAAQGDE